MHDETQKVIINKEQLVRSLSLLITTIKNPKDTIESIIEDARFKEVKIEESLYRK